MLHLIIPVIINCQATEYSILYLHQNAYNLVCIPAHCIHTLSILDILVRRIHFSVNCSASRAPALGWERPNQPFLSFHSFDTFSFTHN